MTINGTSGSQGVRAKKVYVLLYLYTLTPFFTFTTRSGLYSEQASLMGPVYTEKCIIVLKQVILIARVVFISSGLHSEKIYIVYIYN